MNKMFLNVEKQLWIPTFKPYTQSLRGSCSPWNITLKQVLSDLIIQKPLSHNAHATPKGTRNASEAIRGSGGPKDTVLKITSSSRFSENPGGNPKCFFKGTNQNTTTKNIKTHPVFWCETQKQNLRKLGTKKFVQLFTSTNIIFPILTHQNAPNRLFETSGFFGVQDLIRWDQSSIR